MLDGCRHCCQGHSQLPTRGDRAGISARQTAAAGRSWTVRPLLRIWWSCPMRWWTTNCHGRSWTTPQAAMAWRYTR